MHARPQLPTNFANPNIKDHLNAPHLPPVKYQILNCQGKDILVGRLKIETPTETGHAFILRRFDTGAISLTTMFRAAFPNATDQDEKIEIQWVRDNFDLSGNNGSTKDAHITRLAGTWVSPKVALELGREYALGTLINVVVDAAPDPNGNYRRSGKAAAAAAAPPTTNGTTTVTATTQSVASTTIVVSKPPSAAKSLPTPSPTAAVPPAKRRKESSPIPSQSSKPPSRASPSPAKTVVRRSTRTKSPAPRSTATAPLTSLPNRTPKATRSSARQEAIASTSLTPGGSDLTAIDEENQLVEEGMGEELREQDIEEQQKLIQDLKSKREAAKSEHGEGSMDTGEAWSKKRERDEEEVPLKFEFKEPETEDRVIATNTRVGRFHMEPRTKSFAWGVAAFAVGMGAVFLPSFF
ncbi:hypothetical protein GALMADRAFT_247727 [Galerina marginata CBS 339.88]|uniref:HTH APSES-type domain-containing protein n=1 Tax=Galerina marginata (strain CBS 339.88) TaxID=685588 RepID=A0A067SZG5_GALM3|nr:hypothetical protein GALMADRAFT_247727 [Galerina marginata CBS 339.88]